MTVALQFKPYRLRIRMPRGRRFLGWEELHRQLNFPAPNFNALA